MWMTRVAINNPVFATMVMVALCVLGLFSYARLGVEQKVSVPDHLFEGNEPSSQFSKELFLLLKPLVETAASKLAFFMPQEPYPIRGGNHLLPMNIIKPESHGFHLVLNIAPNDGLHTFQFPGEEAELEF